VVGGRFTNSLILSVNASATATITSAVTVSANQNTLADIYVAPPAGAALNITGVAATDTTATSAAIGASSVQVPTGASRRLWIQGTGIAASAGTTVSVSGSGVTVTSPPDALQDGLTVVRITVAAGAAAGPRNIIITNANLDTSVLTGGLIIQ